MKSRPRPAGTAVGQRGLWPFTRDSLSRPTPWSEKPPKSGGSAPLPRAVSATCGQHRTLERGSATPSEDRQTRRGMGRARGRLNPPLTASSSLLAQGHFCAGLVARPNSGRAAQVRRSVATKVEEFGNQRRLQYLPRRWQRRGELAAGAVLRSGSLSFDAVAPFSPEPVAALGSNPLRRRQPGQSPQWQPPPWLLCSYRYSRSV